LLVWQLAKEFGADLYRLCATRPRAESAVTSQLRRSALAIATNIAEGCGKSSRAETIRYLDIAAGSAAETEHHLEVACDVGVIDSKTSEELLSRVASIRRMLKALIDKLPR
ncbi:MAG: four helix bundle protein, partial [Myxococcales bacterium]